MEQSGWKEIREQFITYPFIGPLQFADRRDLLIPASSLDPQDALQSYLTNNRQKYRQFIRQKGRHPTVDIYACFQPFNEAFKALYNFIPYMQGLLKPGDIVLNLWDRSGWTASMLAGWFPEQEIWTVWEGDKDILGYKGFDYWMSCDQRRRHQVLFADFERPLPIESCRISAVVGFDVLHRFHQPDLLREIDRVAKPSAPIVFPHVHLTNNFPDPFFERGCRQLHGNDYAAMFEKLEPITGRRGYILSEPASFALNDNGNDETTGLVSTSDHTDYNGCIAWLDPATNPYLKPWRGHAADWKKYHLLQNPFLAIDSVHHRIEWNTLVYGDQIDELLQWHRVYDRKIRMAIGASVPEKWEKFLYWASQGKTLEEIAAITCVPRHEMQSFLEEAWRLDLAQAVPIDAAGFRLQTLLGQQQYISEETEMSLDGFWKQASEWFGDATWIRAGDTVLSYAQGDELIAITRKALAAEGLKRGDTVMMCTALHYETLIFFWAAVSAGVIVAPVSVHESAVRIQRLAELLQPRMAFTDPQHHSLVSKRCGVRTVMTDLTDHSDYDADNSFEALLNGHADGEIPAWTSLASADVAVILSTTGSTGNPKLIPLTHAQIIRSGRIMTETFHWKSSDKYLAVGGLETMSGLRHATICVAEVGATCVIGNMAGNIHAHLADIQKEEVTILAANPAFYRQLIFAAHAAGRNRSLSSVRLALCTGNALPMAIRTKWYETSGTMLLNYYGLTETSGICIAEHPGYIFQDERSIGMPVGCLAKIVDESGERVAPGMQGELCVYGAGIFAGYYNNAEGSAAVLKDGWFHTKDLAVISADGSILLCGRISDILKLPSGERIEIAAMEQAISSLGGIQDFAVCPIRDLEKEYAAVFFVAEHQHAEHEIVQAIRDVIAREIGHYAVPRVISAVKEIPRGNHHKILRKQLTDALSNSYQV